MKQLIEEHLTSATHLSKRHIHPRLLKMFEMGGMSAVFTRAAGQYMWDIEGARYLDLLAGGGVYFLGRNHPQINAALRDVLELELPNLTVVNASALGGLLAERLLELGGPHFGKVVFANSGSEAIEVCIRFTRYMTRRRRFLALTGAFHGRTFGAISLCGFGQMKEGQDPMMPTVTPIRPNDVAALRAELSKRDVAALFIEPVQGMTTEVMDAAYMREAEALCKQYGTVLVCDEIQTGLGRTGSWFASAELGVRPGMMTVSKTLAGGQVPVSAVLLSEEVYEGVYSKFKSGPIYFSTFAENNLAMAAGIATIDVLRELDAPTRARELGEQLRNGLIDIASRYDCIERISGKGLMLAIYFKPSERLGLRVQQELLGVADEGAFATAVNCDMFAKQRVIVQIPGPELNAIKILPPVTITDEDVRYFLGALDDTLAGYYKVGGPIVTLAGGLVKDTVRSVRRAIPVLGDKDEPKPVAAASPSGQQKKKLGRTDEPRALEFHDYTSPIVDHCEFVVVGSGPGGAYLAHRLAALGRSVVLVEAGPVVRTRDFQKDAGQTLARYFFDGGLRRTNGNLFMPTMQARCLGGGSVFNSAICMRAPLFAVEKWRREHGVIGCEPDVLRPHYERVEAFMHVREVDKTVQGRRNELFAAGCEAIGATATVIARNEDGCRGSSNCFTGCPTRAKQSLDIRGVPEMLDDGGRVYTSVSCDTLLLDGKRVRGIEGVAIEPFTGRKTERVRITAKCTILAAGALASPVIMQRSGIDRDPIGRNLQFHPGTAMMGLFPDEVAPWSGATQGYHCLDFMEQGIKLESLWVAPSLLAFRFPGIGVGLKDLIARYNNMASWDVWVSGEDSVGRVRARPGGGHDFRYRIEQGDVRRMQEGMAKLVEMYFATGATAVYPGVHGLPTEITDASGADIVRNAKLTPGDFPIASNHVFGSTAMGEDPKRHVVDSSGAAWEVDDLYVCDTGIIPTTPAANPMLTIMAIADRMGDTLHGRY